MKDKEVIIKAIAERIKEEQKKHERNIPDWHEIAARKIYVTLLELQVRFDILSLIEEFREKELPNRNQPYHYEAEIAAGLKQFELFIKSKTTT
jgi:hypothetical protein